MLAGKPAPTCSVGAVDAGRQAASDVVRDGNTANGPGRRHSQCRTAPLLLAAEILTSAVETTNAAQTTMSSGGAHV
jgi:hypothetical protein